MGRNRDDIVRKIQQSEAKLVQLQIRQALLETEAWRGYRAGFIVDLQNTEEELLKEPEWGVPADVAIQRIRFLQGKRQVLMAMLFDGEETQQAVGQVAAAIQGLRLELEEWDTGVRRQPP